LLCAWFRNYFLCLSRKIVDHEESGMVGTRWKKVVRRCLGEMHRELKITFTPVPTGKRWVFIVGCYNSGTTLLSEILSTHPLISGLTTEGQFLTDQFPSDHILGLPRMWVRREDLYRLTEKDEGPDVARIKKEWGMRLDLSKTILLEKSPPNGARTRWLQKHFEDAHFIAIIRNPYAAIEGISRKADPQHLKDGWPLQDCARQWSRSNEVIEEDSHYLDRFMWTRYEDIVEKTTTELERILRFIGIEERWDFDSQKLFAVHERNEPIKNMNMQSLRRLSREDLEIINGIAGKHINHFGYEVISEPLLRVCS